MNITQDQMKTVIHLARQFDCTNVTPTDNGAVRVWCGRLWYKVKPDGTLAGFWRG